MLHETNVLVPHLLREILQLCFRTASVDGIDAAFLPILDKRLTLQCSDSCWHQEEQFLQSLPSLDFNPAEEKVKVLAVMHLADAFCERVVDLGFRGGPLVAGVENRILHLVVQSSCEEAPVAKFWSLLDSFEERPAKEANLQAMLLLFGKSVVCGLLLTLRPDDRLSCVILHHFISILNWFDHVGRVVNLRREVPVSDDLVANNFGAQFLHHASNCGSLVFHDLLGCLPIVGIFRIKLFFFEQRHEKLQDRDFTVTHGTQQLHKGLEQILVVLEQCAEGKLICALSDPELIHVQKNFTFQQQLLISTVRALHNFSSCVEQLLEHGILCL
mmetsp:Transcript_35141/g.84244  ORF Transcript_35141/g.84244 Transcript_35141/m.84244 type:complete len:329 (-) Transcript_35141:157-1143(-)